MIAPADKFLDLGRFWLDPHYPARGFNQNGTARRRFGRPAYRSFFRGTGFSDPSVLHDRQDAESRGAHRLDLGILVIDL